MSRNIDMTAGRPLPLLVRFALPLMLGSIFQQLYTVVDTVIVGQGLGLDALAALGAVGSLTWLMTALLQGFAQGFSIRVSQKFGENEPDGLRRAMGQSARLAIIIAAIAAVVSQLALPLVFLFLRVPNELWPLSELYIRILMLGLPPIMLYNYTSAMLRAVGDSRTPLTAMVAASLVNIVLDLVTVFVFHWGIAGAAIATVLSQLISGVICTVRIVRFPVLHFKKADMIRDRTLSRDLIRLGTPMALKSVIVSFSAMLVQSAINGFGLDFIAGITATNRLFGLLEIAAISYGFAVTTYVGQNFGASNLARIRPGMRSATILGLATACSIAVCMFLFGRPLTMLFISADSPELAHAAGDTAYLFLRIISLFLPTLYLSHIYQSALQGLGLTLNAMIAGFLELIIRGVIVAFVYITGFEQGVFVAGALAWTGASLYFMGLYARQARRLSL